MRVTLKRRGLSLLMAAVCILALLPILSGAAEGCGFSAGSTESPPVPMCGNEHYAYITGYPDGTVRPEAPISRAEAATVFFRVLTDELRAENRTKENSFTDVKEGDWYNNAVSVMAKLGIINGYADGAFRPDNNITRGELAKIAAEFALMMGAAPIGEVDFNDISGHWAEIYIRMAATQGWVTGYADGSYRPEQAITRAEFMTLVNRMFGRVPQKPEDLLDGMIRWPDNADVSAWYYLAVQEATNSHDYTFKEDSDGDVIFVPGLDIPYEIWIELWPPRDWAELERVWSNAY